MPRSFDMSTDYAESVEAVLRAFGDEQYWLARLADSGVDDSTVDSMEVDDGVIDVVTTQVLRADRMPALVTQFHRGDLRIRREERWEPIVDGSATATVTGSVLDSPASLTGTAVLEPLADGGARLQFRATVEVKIPLVGGKLENFIGGQLVELLIREQRFTTTWISETA
ncbi:hypothetical protein A5658_10660 [Mycobacterium sp. 1245111.1]|uniref:DUF2505 domain-containing protein n=1 Tax=Mycobacterium sp. 1245111.1 TaxID=1834073 RepID=UPI0008001961|nr:DUF2505 domain-containing protein [Mycobacterium sp. 1245111.1]OBK34861.1 hypothetical protein A5658_10660 [Mycobacterium sp. 1245111.1]